MGESENRSHLEKTLEPFYQRASESEAQDLRREPYVLERNVAGFSRRPLISMEVLELRELLLSLSELITFHRLLSLETNAVITKPRAPMCILGTIGEAFCASRGKRKSVFSDMTERLSRLEAALTNKKGAKNEDHLKLISELQSKLEEANVELVLDRAKPTQQQTRYWKSPYAPVGGEDGGSAASEDGTTNV